MYRIGCGSQPPARHRQTDWQTDIQRTGRQADRQTGRPVRQTDGERAARRAGGESYYY